MAKRIWDGTGRLEEGEAFWTKTRSQELVGGPYVRRLARQRIHKHWRCLFSLEARNAAADAVLTDDFLLRSAGQTVGSVARDASDRALSILLRDYGVES